MIFYYTVEYVNKETGLIATLAKAFTTWNELAQTCRSITKSGHNVLTINFKEYE